MWTSSSVPIFCKCSLHDSQLGLSEVNSRQPAGTGALEVARPRHAVPSTHLALTAFITITARVKEENVFQDDVPRECFLGTQLSQNL